MRVKRDLDVDVIIVGAGPAGSATAYWLATKGISALLLEKAQFPRDKVCGDGLTPTAIRELIEMGINLDPTQGWVRNRGLRVIGGGHTVELPWVEQPSLPNFGSCRSRAELDEILARHAQAAGAQLETGMMVTGAITDSTGRVAGVTARRGRGAEAEEFSFSARLVVDCGGVSARLATSSGRERSTKRPMGVAVRSYYRSPLADDEWMTSHLELWDGKAGESNLLPGYGWVFPQANGIVNVGLGSVSSSGQATKLPYREIFSTWVANLPPEWGLTPENQVGELRSAALPMAFNRKPLYADGLLLVGDAGGMVSPFNGEGIGPALFAGRHAAASIAQALARGTGSGFDLALSAYPAALKEQWGGYYQLGRIFVSLIEHPEVMRVCTRYGLPRPRLMKLVHKLLSDGYERRGGDLSDRLLQSLAKAVPAA